MVFKLETAIRSTVFQVGHRYFIRVILCWALLSQVKYYVQGTVKQGILDTVKQSILDTALLLQVAHFKGYIAKVCFVYSFVPN